MRQLTRYLLIQLSIMAGLITVALTLAIWLAQSLRFVDFMVNRGLPASQFLQFILLLMPSFLGIVMPIATVVAIFFVYHRLNQESELVVMRASGMSTFALARPALILTGGVTLIAYLIAFYFLPLSFRNFKDLQNDISRSYASVLIQEGIFNPIGGRVTVYVRARDPDGALRGIIVQDDRNRERPVTLIAERGALVRSDEESRVLLVNGNRQETIRGTGEVNNLVFERYTVDLTPLSRSEGPRWRNPQERFLGELLWPQDPETLDNPRRYRELIAEFHQRMIEPLYTVAFAMIGLVAMLCGTFNRRGRPLRIAAAAAIVGALQGLNFMGQDVMNQDPDMAPLVYMIPVVPIAISIYLLQRGTRLAGKPLRQGPVAA
ncbi:MAG: LPS export ABC transporter permease LptF [Rhodospirillales bacterium]